MGITEEGRAAIPRVTFTVPIPDDDCWHPVVHFEDLYQVHRRGHVRSVERLVDQLSRWGHPVANLHRGKVLTPFVTPAGRLRVVLHDEQHRRHARYVDELVADAFGVVQ